jgi:hypothetical protein
MTAVPTIQSHRVGNQLHVEGAISDAQWEGIARSLAAVGVNANAVKVGCRFVPGVRQWSINDPGAPRRPLRAVLEEMAYCYILSEYYKPPTTKQRADQFEKARIAVETARDLLRDATWVFPHYPDRDLSVDRGKDDALEHLLTWKEADLRGRIDKLSAGGGSSMRNAMTRYSEYWRGLTLLWLAITKIDRYRRKHLRRFLFACSEPLFSKMTSSELDRLIDGFVHGFFKKRLSKPHVGKRASKAALV